MFDRSAGKHAEDLNVRKNLPMINLRPGVAIRTGPVRI
jgi:hypothetical protein